MCAQDNIKWAKSVKELGNDYNTKMSDDIDLVTLYPNYLLLKIGGGGACSTVICCHNLMLCIIVT